MSKESLRLIPTTHLILHKYFWEDKNDFFSPGNLEYLEYLESTMNLEFFYREEGERILAQVRLEVELRTL